MTTEFFTAAYLERLVPTTQSTTNSGGCNFLTHRQFVCLSLASESPDGSLCCLRYAHTATPSRDLPEGNGIDTFVDSSDALGTQDIEECLHGTRYPGPLGHLLVPRDLHGLHARGHAHGQIRLSSTTSHTSKCSGYRRREPEIIGCEIGHFGGCEDQDGPFGSRFNDGL